MRLDREGSPRFSDEWQHWEYVCVRDMIILDNLSKHFGPLVAVDGISMQVAKGEVLGFLGPNAAGKSTTMKMITGFLTPTSGSAHVCGMDVWTDPLAVKRRIGYLPEGAPSYDDLTPTTFLDFIADIRGFQGKEKKRRIDAVVERVSLGDVLHQPIETLSKGFKRRVGLAQAMIHDPDVLILDEPTDGLDPNQKFHVRGLIQEMARDKAIIISTHILEEVESVCTRAVIIANGALIADGSAETLQARHPAHHSIKLKVSEQEAESLRTHIYPLPHVETIQTHEPEGGEVVMQVFAKSGHTIATPLAELIRDRKVHVSMFQVEKGKLDEVFREITGHTNKETSCPPPCFLP